MLWWTLKQLESLDASKRQQAAQKLGKAKNAKAVEPLAAALRDEESFVREAAAEALGKIGDAQAVTPLVAALGDEYCSVRTKAAKSLMNLGWQPADVAQRAWITVAQEQWDEVVRLKTAAVEPLIAALKDKVPSVRTEAIVALGEIGDERAVEPLLARLKDKDNYVRGEAAEALGRIGGKRAVEPLLAALGDWNDRVRLLAAEALKSLGWQPAYNAELARLAIAQKNWNETVRLNGAAIDPLLEALNDWNPHVRKAAAEALGKIGDRRAIDPLVAALKGGDWDVRKAVAAALGELNWTPGDDTAREWLITARVGFGMPRCDPRTPEEEWDLAKWHPSDLFPHPMDDDNAHCKVHESQIEAVTSGPQEDHLRDPDALLKMYQHIEVHKARMTWKFKLKWIVEEVLHENWDENVFLGVRLIELIIQLHVLSLRDTDYFVRATAAEMLGQSGDARAVEPLVAALKDEHSRVREAAAKALGEIGDARAIEPLVASLKDPEQDVRRAAAAPLRTRGWQPADDVEQARLAVILKRWDDAVSLKAAALEPLLEALEDPWDEYARKGAAEALGKIGDARARAPLYTRLNDPRHYVRQAASDALSKMGDGNALAASGSPSR